MITPAETANAVSALGTTAVRALEQLQDFQAFSGHNYDRYGKLVGAGQIEETWRAISAWRVVATRGPCLLFTRR